MFAERKLVIATKHGKERVIAPILEQALGVTCLATDTLDTDLLGTFTGEVERSMDPLATAREKCVRAMELTGCDLAVANEGSFGPHPVMVFAPGDEELMLLLDRRNGLELAIRELSADTNFASAQVSTEHELLAFADKADFPGHALILRPSPDSSEEIHKGIAERVQLLDTFRALCERHGRVTVETDMRAMLNPTRMSVIADATRKLVALAQSSCPRCAAPGFAETDLIRGLPCELCGLPTKAPVAYVSTCQQCGHTQERPRPDGKTAEDPMYCDFCNP